MRVGGFGAWLRLILLMLAAAAALLWTGRPWALALLPALPLLSLMSLLWNLLARRGLSLTLSGPVTTEKSRALRLSVRATWRLPPLGRVSCRLCVRSVLSGEETSFPLTLHRGQALGQLTSVCCGQLRITGQELLLWDAVGLLALAVPVNAVWQTTVLPDTFPLELSPSLLLAAAEDAPTQAPRRGDDPTELFALRDYVPGDDLRGIHWKLTAKTGHLLYRQPGQTELQRLTLYWDPCGTPQQTDALAEAIFSVAQALSEGGVPFALAWTEEGVLCRREIGGGGMDSLPELLAVPPTVTTVPQLPEQTLLFTCLPERIPAEGRLRVLLCGSYDGADPRVLAFRPEDAARALRRLDFAL